MKTKTRKMQNLSAIAAIGKNNELGMGGNLIWQLSKDLQHFKEITTPHPIIMGRKTYESIGKALPNRDNYVLSKRDLKEPGVISPRNVKETLEMIGDRQAFVIGGEEIYKLFFHYVDTLYLTLIDREEKGADTHFPSYDNFECVQREVNAPENGIEFSFVTYKRAK